MRTATQVLPQERSSNVEPQRRERGDGETSALDGERAWAGGVSQAVRDGGVSECLVERAIGGAQVSSTRAAKGAIGAFVGGFGVQHCGLDPAGLASWARVRAGGASGGVAAVGGAKRAGKRPETTVSGPLGRPIRSRGAEVAVPAGAAFGSAELGALGAPARRRDNRFSSRPLTQAAPKSALKRPSWFRLVWVRVGSSNTAVQTNRRSAATRSRDRKEAVAGGIDIRCTLGQPLASARGSGSAGLGEVLLVSLKPNEFRLLARGGGDNRRESAGRGGARQRVGLWFQVSAQAVDRRLDDGSNSLIIHEKLGFGMV